MNCKICGKKAESEYCFQHKKRKSLTKSVRNNNTEDATKMRNLFLSLWNKHPHYSEISGEYLGNECLNIFFHHILPWRKFPQGKLDEEDIIILTLNEHTNVESNPEKYEEINRRRKLLKIKYNLL